MAAPSYTGTVGNVVLPSPKDLPSVGGIYVAPTTVSVPTNFTIDSGAKHLGFIGADGVDEKEDRNVKNIYDWGGDTIATPQENYNLMVSFTLLEWLNPEVQKVLHRTANVTVTAATSSAGTKMSVLQTSDLLEMRSWYLDTYAPGGKHILKFYPLGRVESKDVLKFARTDVLATKVSVRCFPDSTGAYSYMNTDDNVFSA